MMEKEKTLTPGRSLTENELELLRALLEILDATEAGQKDKTYEKD